MINLNTPTLSTWIQSESTQLKSVTFLKANKTSSLPNKAHLWIICAKDRFRIGSLKPVAENRAVHTAEIHGVLDISF